MGSSEMTFRVIGMDCEHDAREVAEAIRGLPGVDDARVSVVSQQATVVAGPPAEPAAIIAAVGAAGYGLEPVTADEPAHRDPAYRRALWIVVVLNLGYGVMELVAGVLSRSQALKADALDFIGDGLITLLAVVAVGWALRWRARVAQLEGVFLGLLGLGVIGTSLARLEQGYRPDAEAMGVYGVIAMIVNVLAVMALARFRTGDSNMTAIWMFSRNDALGNLAVVIAGGLVAVTDRFWPDLVVALVVAGLFLQSAWAILADARRDLATG